MRQTKTNDPAARVESVARAIHLIRGQKVILDADLAVLYGVELRTMNQAVHRNKERFPLDFMFQLTEKESDNLRSQIVISNSAWNSQRGTGRGGRRYLPYAFTEQGVAMLSSVLRSKRAVLVNIEIMRAFVRLCAVGGEVTARFKPVRAGARTPGRPPPPGSSM